MSVATSAETIEQDSPGVSVMPPAVFFTCLIVGGLLEFLAPRDVALIPTPVGLILGLGLGGAGFAFMMAAHQRFESIGTNVPTNLPATTFVVHGAYRFSRNPMYVGGVAFFLGIGLMADSLWMMAACIPLGLYLARYVVPREEAYLERAFGDRYRAYCLSVRRWL